MDPSCAGQRSRARDLSDGAGEPFERVPQTAVVAGCAQLGERVADLVVVLLEVAAALLGQSGQLAATLPGDRDIALVLEQGERGIDRAGAGRQAPSVRAAISCMSW